MSRFLDRISGRPLTGTTPEPTPDPKPAPKSKRAPKAVAAPKPPVVKVEEKKEGKG
jgi:hypothetical protein